MTYSNELYSVREKRLADEVVKVYREIFKNKFLIYPTVSTNDTKAAYEVARQWDTGKEKLFELIGAYFELQDDFIEKSGYALRFFPSRINALATGAGVSKEKVRVGYIYDRDGNVVEIFGNKK